MKKILLSLLALCAATSLWALNFQSGLLYYRTLSDSTVEVTYQEFSSNTEYSSSVTGSPNNYSTLTAVAIPETVTYNSKTYTVVAIGKYAFTQTYNYRANSNYRDTVASSVRNTQLKLINIPKTVKHINKSAFAYCTALTTINFLGDGLESIGDYAFTGCTALKSFYFPQTLKDIGSYAFSSSALAGDIIIPENVTSIGNNAFAYTKMSTLSIGNSVSTINNSVFKSCSGLTSVTLGNSVATIGTSAFESCTNLTSITLPKSVKTIQNYAFASCSKLTTVYLKPTTPPYFTNINILPSSAKTFYVPCGAADTYFLSDWVTFTTTFQEECDKKYTIYVNQDCTSSVVEQ